VETEAAPELLGVSEPTELAENSAEAEAITEVLGLAVIVWRLEPVSENCAEFENVFAPDIV
jgi:hypothetical protein